MPSNPSAGSSWRKEATPYNLYRLLLLTLAHLMLQINRFILAIVAKPVAQDLKFGDKACMVNTSLTAADNVNGSDASDLCRRAENVCVLKD